jgi:hypothetical protein
VEAQWLQEQEMQKKNRWEDVSSGNADMPRAGHAHRTGSRCSGHSSLGQRSILVFNTEYFFPTPRLGFLPRFNSF